MIKYLLKCDQDHEFEGWFRDSADFDAQSRSDLVECPVCGSAAVTKAVMAPAVARRSGSRDLRLREIQHDIAKAMERARDHVEKNFDYVGDRFPEEARKIHYGEAEDRGVYGEASGKEVKELIDEGIKVAPLPGEQRKTDRADRPKARSSANKKLN